MRAAVQQHTSVLEERGASAHQLNLSIPGDVGLGAVSINCATIARAGVIVQDTQGFIITPAVG